MISRFSALGVGLLISALSAFLMVAPLWYLATTQRRLFNVLVVASLVLAITAGLLSRFRRPRRGPKNPARPS